MLTVTALTFDGDVKLLGYRFSDGSKVFSRLGGNEHYPQIMLEVGTSAEQLKAIRQWWKEQESEGPTRAETLKRLRNHLARAHRPDAIAALEKDIECVENGGDLAPFMWWLFE